MPRSTPIPSNQSPGTKHEGGGTSGFCSEREAIGDPASRISLRSIRATCLSAFALHRFVREPLELDRKWMSKAHLTLRHDQACSIRFRRNPPLSACASAPKELASRILMVEGGRLKDQRSREPVPAALKFSLSSKAYPHTLS